MSQDYKRLFEKFEDNNVDLKKQLMAKDEELGAVYADMEAMMSQDHLTEGHRITQNSKNRDDFDHMPTKKPSEMRSRRSSVNSSSCPRLGGLPSLQTIRGVCAAESRL